MVRAGPPFHSGGAVSAGKEDVPGAAVPDEEQEGVVRIEGLSDHGRAHVDNGGGGGGGLRPLFVDVHVSLVDDLGEDQVVPGRHACGWVGTDWISFCSDYGWIILDLIRIRKMLCFQQLR